jgi:hypothetical protein
VVVTREMQMLQPYSQGWYIRLHAEYMLLVVLNPYLRANVRMRLTEKVKELVESVINLLQWMKK